MARISTLESSRTGLLIRASIAAAVLLVVAFLLVSLTMTLQGSSIDNLLSPIEWLDALDRSVAIDTVANAADLLAAILAIAITVVAIVVELAANRYSHRITSLFVREPTNIVVMSFFVVATIQSVWVSLTLAGPAEAAPLPNAGLLMSMAMVTISLIILLPYFAFVLSFLSPVSVIDKIRHGALKSLQLGTSGAIEKAELSIQNSVDELQDITRRASELRDRAVETAAINALAELLLAYQSVLDDLPAEWFEVSGSVATDPDFVSMSPSSLREIEESGTWVEAKILRQYMDLISNGDPSSRDISYLIAINTKRIGIDAIGRRPQLVELSTRCFNSYLRATINNHDQRTTYYIMNQYRLLAEELLKGANHTSVKAIALHLQFYGLMGFKMQMPFLLEVAAYDIMQLIEACSNHEPDLIDDLLNLMLQLDQEIKDESNQESLLGVRRAQIQLAAYFLNQDDVPRARRICKDLKSEQRQRLNLLRELLLTEDRPQYWEFTDRGVNFSYMKPEERPHLDELFAWIDA